MKKNGLMRKYISVDKRAFPDVIYIPYDPAYPEERRCRESFMEEFLLDGYTYIDACKVSYYGETRHFWILKREK